jgi:hypothetical protein
MEILALRACAIVNEQAIDAAGYARWDMAAARGLLQIAETTLGSQSNALLDGAGCNLQASRAAPATAAQRGRGTQLAMTPA